MANSNGNAKGFAIPIGAVIGIAGTVLVGIGSYAASQFNQLRLDFEHERLQARREYAEDLSRVRAGLQAELVHMRTEMRDALLRERSETQAGARELAERIDEALALGREINQRQDELIERVQQYRYDGTFAK